MRWQGRWPPPPQKARYYPLLAQAASKEAIDALLAADDRQAAFAALLTVQNPAMVDVLYDLARQNPAWTDAAISRYTDFVIEVRAIRPCANTSYTAADWRRNPSPKVQNKLLKALSKTPVFPALTLAVNYMDAPATAETAAMVVKTVAAKNPALGGETVAAALKKAQEVYAGLAKSDADAGYAVDEIKGLLAKLPAEGYVPVSLEPSGSVESRGRRSRRPPGDEAQSAGQGASRKPDAAAAENMERRRRRAHGNGREPRRSGRRRSTKISSLIVEWKTDGEAGSRHPLDPANRPRRPERRSA